MSMPVSEVRKHLMNLPFEQRTELAYEVLDGMADDHPDETGGAHSLSAEAIARRVEEIRNGAPLTADEQEILEDRADAEPDGVPFDDEDDQEEDENSAEVEAAWSDEIERRIQEIRDGTAKTYAMKDVMVALTLRYG